MKQFNFTTKPKRKRRKNPSNGLTTGSEKKPAPSCLSKSTTLLRNENAPGFLDLSIFKPNFDQVQLQLCRNLLPSL